MSKRYVWLGTKNLIGGTPVIIHWAVLVSDDDCAGEGSWFEVQGAGKKSNGVGNEIIESYGSQSDGGATSLFSGPVGKTTKSDNQIRTFNKEWLNDNPEYHYLVDNCQKYAKELIQYLTDGCAKLPPMEGGLEAHADGPRAQALATDGYASARATTGTAGAHWGIFDVEAEGPSASAMAAVNHSFGAFGDASLGRAELNTAIAGIRVEPNINTGAGIRDGNLEARLLGLGASVGEGGIQVHTPIGSVRACSIM